MGTCYDLVLGWDIVVSPKPNAGATLNWKILSPCIGTYHFLLELMTLLELGYDELVQPKPNTGATIIFYWNSWPCIGIRSTAKTQYRGNLELHNVTTLYWEIKRAQYREYLVLDDILKTNKGIPWIGVRIRYVFTLYWTWQTNLLPIQGGPCIGMVYHLVLEKIKWLIPCIGKVATPNTRYAGFRGRKPVESISKIANTGRVLSFPAVQQGAQ